MKSPMIFTALAALGLLTFSPAANAQLAFDESGGILGQFSNETIGYSFNVLTPLSVTELDAYIGGGFPSATVPVGIWNASGTLLTSATISTTSPATTTPSALGGNYAGAPISPLSLSVGTYTIGEFDDNPDDTAVVFGKIISNPAVSYGDEMVSAGGEPSLSEPTNNNGLIGLFGPSFKFTTQSAPSTPEPGSVTLLIGMATVGAGILRKRRK